MYQKYLLLLFTFYCSLFTCVAQQFWVQGAGGITIDEGISIATDANGNSYSTGYFTTTASFGTTTLHSAGSTDIYVTKLNSHGQFVWAVKAGGAGTDRPTAIKVDPHGNSYITGYFYDTAYFGPFSIVSAGIQDVFIAKYDPNGNCLWVRSCGGSSSDIGNSIAVDFKGNVIVTGQFKDTAGFGNYNLVGIDSCVNVFTTKLDSNGNFLWAKKGSGAYTDRGLGVACDNIGEIYITGQFSDTITFDQQYPNEMYNAIFLLKYDANGNALWFRRMGGGGLDIPRGIIVDNYGNPTIVGDFEGDITFFDLINNSILSSSYLNRIFIVQFNTKGELQWSSASSSNGGITSKDIAVDASNNYYVVGNFECRLNDYADYYGQGTFNSVGQWDIFVSKWNSSGTWQWSRQIGGQQDDNGSGIAVDASQNVLLTGSFSQQLFFPVRSSNFIGYGLDSLDGCSNSYCGDSHYKEYERLLSNGNSDIFIANAIDLNRQPYDYYARTDSSCNRDVKGVKILPLNQDTVRFCGTGTLNTQSNTCSILGPEFNYLWSNGGTNSSLSSVSTTGLYWVQQTTADGCIVSSDSIYVIVHPNPPKPTISDNQGVNTNASITNEVVVCAPTQVLITGGNFGTNQYFWTNGPINDSTYLVTHSSNYYFNVKDSFGCTNRNNIIVVIDSALVPIVPAMKCMQDTGSGAIDTISICIGNPFSVFVYDTISNPTGTNYCSPNIAYDPYSVSSNPDNPLIFWTVTPANFNYTSVTTTCYTFPYDGNTFNPTQSGLYTITALVARATLCDTDTVVVSKSIYVNVSQVPVAAITGNTFFCPGDSTVLTASGGTNFIWSNSSHSNNIWVSTVAEYYLTVTNPGGCTSTASINISSNQQPAITIHPSSGIICPNDSAQFVCSGNGSFVWQGPDGPIGGNTNLIYASDPGIYYCIVMDSNGCVLVSNELELDQYNTPYIQTLPSTAFCHGDSILLNIISNPGSTIQWNAPLSGNSWSQYVHNGGTFSCSITTCNITTTSFVNLYESNTNASITTTDTILCPGDSLILSGNSGMTSYQWLPGTDFTSHKIVNQPGVYYLMVRDSIGCSSTDSITISESNNSITSSFAAAPLVGCDTVVVHFNNTSTNASTYLWYFGDNSFSTLANPVHSYINTGSYSVKLITTNTNTCGTFKDSIIQNNYVTIYPKPIASFTTDTMTGCVPFTVNFNNTSSNANVYFWNFGNQNTSTSTNPNTTYTAVGVYSVTLVASNTGGCNDTISLNNLSVIAPPVIFSSFTADTLFGCNPLTVQFTNNSTNGMSYIWNFGDNSISNQMNVTHTFTDSGLFTVKLISINDTSICGRIADTAIRNNYISVDDSIHVTSNFSGTPLNGCIPLVISLTNSSNNGTNSYWDFGNGQYSTDANQSSAIYDHAGTFNLRLITSNPNARCASLPDTISMEVIADSCYLAGSNVFTPNGDGVNDYFNVVAEGDFTNYHIEIFNRWGTKLFESFQPKYLWDGTIDGGTNAPDGTYYYIFTAIDTNEKMISQKGYITLIR